MNAHASNVFGAEIDIERLHEDGHGNSNIDFNDRTASVTSKSEYGSSSNFAPYGFPEFCETYQASTGPQSNSNKVSIIGTPNYDVSEKILQDLKYYQDCPSSLSLYQSLEDSVVNATMTYETENLCQIEDNIRQIEPIQCTASENIFSCYDSLKVHNLTHTEARPFKCKLCSSDYKREWDLAEHLDVMHTMPGDGSTHQCTRCDKKLRTEYSLKMHYLTHIGERFFKCKICGWEFKRKHNLKKHLIDVHTKREAKRTPVCNKMFSKSAHLQKHTEINSLLQLIPLHEKLKCNPLALTNNSKNIRESKRETTNKWQIEGFKLNENVSPNCGISDILNPAYNSSSPCKFKDNLCKGLHSTLLEDIYEFGQNNLADEKLNYFPSGLTLLDYNLFEATESPQDRLSSVKDIGDVEFKIQKDSLNIMHHKSYICNLEKQRKHISNKNLPKSTTDKHAFIISPHGGKPLSPKLYSSSTIPSNIKNNSSPHNSVSVPDFENYSMPVAKHHVQDIISNFTHPLHSTAHCELGLNAPSWYRDIKHISESNSLNITKAAMKNDFDVASNQKMFAQPEILISKFESSERPMIIQTVPAHGNFYIEETFTARSSVAVQCAAGTKMNFPASLDGQSAYSTLNPFHNTCEICYSTFCSQSILKIHYRSHTEEAQFRCEICDNCISTRDNM